MNKKKDYIYIYKRKILEIIFKCHCHGQLIHIINQENNFILIK